MMLGANGSIRTALEIGVMMPNESRMVQIKLSSGTKMCRREFNRIPMMSTAIGITIASIKPKLDTAAADISSNRGVSPVVLTMRSEDVSDAVRVTSF